jgi:hypothetical protein
VESCFIGERDFVRMFNIALNDFPPFFSENLVGINTAWRRPTAGEIEEYVLGLLKGILEEYSQRSVEENQAAFERGWSENLEDISTKGVSDEVLKPRYFRGSKYLRYDKTLIVSQNEQLEYDLFALARTLIFWKYLRTFSTIYEFGCGSCANLLMLAKLFPNKELIGLDWAQASVNIANFLGEMGGLNVRGQRFDFFHPFEDSTLLSGAAVLTIHALEQLGDGYGPWLNFLVRNKPALVVNYEPILEFYDTNNLLDYLALRYSSKRGYLSGYWTTLQEFAKKGLVEIIEARRPYLGGVFHEASLIVWRPL